MLKELILVSGKPGSGKTTASRLAAGLLGETYHFSIGQEVRDRALHGKATRYADELAPYRETLRLHRPIPPEIVSLIVEECITGSQWQRILADGYPQYADRVPGFKATLERAGAVVLGICRIEISDEVARHRLTGRPSRVAGIIEDEAFITSRLEGYYRNAVPAIDALAANYRLITIDGDQQPDNVAADLAEAVRGMRAA